LIKISDTAVIENKKTLAKCLKDEEVEIEIRNLNYQFNEDQFEKFLVDKNILWVEFEFEYDDRDRFRGICYMTCDKANAEKFIEFNGTVLRYCISQAKIFSIENYGKRYQSQC